MSYPDPDENMREDTDCERINPEILKQGRVWVDSKKRVLSLPEIPNGHLDNIILWLEEHSQHNSNWPALPKSALYRELVKLQKRRQRIRNETPEQALQDIVRYDLKMRMKAEIENSFVDIIIEGLMERGFTIVKGKPTKNARERA